jgi:hypothetical protein
MEASGAVVARVRTTAAPESRPAAGAAFPALAKIPPETINAATAAIRKSFIFPSFEVKVFGSIKSPPLACPVWAAPDDNGVLLRTRAGRP